MSGVPASSMSATVGVGLGISARDGHVCVVSIVPTGPAALSGLIAVGDIIVAIDGTAVGGDKCVGLLLITCIL